MGDPSELDGLELLQVFSCKLLPGIKSRLPLN